MHPITPIFFILSPIKPQSGILCQFLTHFGSKVTQICDNLYSKMAFIILKLSFHISNNCHIYKKN